MQILNLIENRINEKLQKKFSFILGLTPSKGARSPKLWNKVYKKEKLKIKMYPADIKKNNLRKFVNELKKNPSVIGGSVTAPYKELIMKHIDNIDNISAKIGSINTISKNNNKLCGFNTDYFGAINSLKSFKNKKNILIFGCGGAGKSVILAVLSKFRNSNIFFFNRSSNKLKKYISKIKFKKKNSILKKITDLNLNNKYDLVINTTSIGFNSWIKKNNLYYNYKELSPLTNLKSIKGIKSKNLKIFKKKNSKLINQDTKNLKNFFNLNKNADIFDIIYFPSRTKLLKYGFKTCKNGSQMNFDQAIKAFQIVNKNNNFNRIRKIMKNNG
jgi:shikimate dehydrogenase